MGRWTADAISCMLRHGGLILSTLRPCASAGVLHLGWKLWTFPRWSDENKHVPRFLLAAAALTVQMFLELLLIWWGMPPASSHPATSTPSC